jgi:hypothetical protein
MEAAIEAGFTRFRPVLMTALAMIIGMIPMALGLGDVGEQNAPLGRAVIGGLLCATVATLVFVPAVFSLFHGRHTSAEASLPPESDHQPIHAKGVLFPGRWRRRRRSVFRLPARARCGRCHPPATPPSATANAVRRAANRTGRRAQGAAPAGQRAVQSYRGHVGISPHIFRTRSCPVTRQVPPGSAASGRPQDCGRAGRLLRSPDRTP